MSEFVTVKARDGHELSAYVVKPGGTPKGALVVVQEIFGVNKHIRSVADGYAKEGYVVVARRSSIASSAVWTSTTRRTR